MNKKSLFALVLLLILAATAYFVSQKKDGNTIRSEAAKMAIADTSAVSRITINDRLGNEVSLEKKRPGYWTVNGKSRARQDVTDLLLETLNRITVKAPVSKSNFNTVLKGIISNGKEVSIYDQDGKVIKTLFVGSSDQHHTGTYMMIKGAEIPYLMHIEGFYGFLEPRFFADYKDWVHTGIFNYSYGQIASIKLTHVEEPEASFALKALTEDQWEVHNNEGEHMLSGVDTAAVLSYVSRYKKIHFEGFEETKTEAFMDSVQSSAPQYIFEVTDVIGNVRTVKTWKKPFKGEDFDGNKIEFDLDRMYALVDNQDFVVIQYFVFDPITYSLGDFVSEQNKGSS